MFIRIAGFISVLVCLLAFTVSGVLAQGATFSSELQIVFSVSVKPADLKADDVRATAEVLAHRLELLEVEGAVVQVVGEKAIQVQMPAIDDPQPIIDALTQTALLELVDFSGLKDQITAMSDSTLLTSAWEADENAAPREGGLNNPLTGEAFETVVTGDDFISVVPALDSSGQWAVQFDLSDEAGERFGEFTEAHIDEPLAIVLDGRVLSIPVIYARLDTHGVIVGNFTEAEVTRLAAQLRAGALPLPLNIKSMETIETVVPPKPAR